MPVHAEIRKDIEVTDPDLGGLIGTVPGPLAPSISTTLAISTAISGDLVNEATATGTPTDPEGQEIPGIGKPIDQDTAEVVDQGVLPPTSLGEEDQPKFEGQRKLFDTEQCFFYIVS